MWGRASVCLAVSLLLMCYFSKCVQHFHQWMAGWDSAFTSPVSSPLAEEAKAALQREPVPPRKGGEQRGYSWLIVPLICGGIFLLSLFFRRWVRRYNTQLQNKSLLSPK